MKRSEIRGYHVYGSSWKPKIGYLLLTDQEVSNEDDKFAVAVYEELGIDGKKTVRHLPVEFSRIAAYFIENSGEISCKVTGKRKHSKGPRGGMAIPCKLCWPSSNKGHVKNLMRSLLQRKSRLFEDMDLVFSCMCWRLAKI